METDNQCDVRISPKFKVINLNYGLRSKQEADLRKAIALQDGHLDVFVHPYYEDDMSGWEYQSYPASSEYIQQRDAFIRHAITTEKPIVIFQDTPGELEGKTRNIQSGIVYLVAGAYSNYLESLASHNIADIFTRVGVTHVTIGGRILMYADDHESLAVLAGLRKLGEGKPYAMEWLSGNRLPYGCPMWAATGFLRRGFDVSFSSISSPAVLNHD